MTDETLPTTIAMQLGDRIFAVPRLPFGANMQAYPLLRRMHNNGFAQRWWNEDGEPTEDDLADLQTVLFICAKAADPELTTDAFLALAISPDDMWGGYLTGRFQSGGWVPAKAEDAPPAGEPEGEGKPPKSTSSGSSPD